MYRQFSEAGFLVTDWQEGVERKAERWSGADGFGFSYLGYIILE